MSKCVEIEIYVGSYASESNTMFIFSLRNLGLEIEHVYNFNFLGLIIYCHLD